MANRETTASLQAFTAREVSVCSDWSPTPIRWRDYFVVLLVALVATLPFLNKAFHIDDILYLQGAYQVLLGKDSFHGEVLWDAADGQPAPLFVIDHNPPLWKYLLAGTIRWLAPDRAEWKLHLLEGLFIWLAALGLLKLGSRLSPFPVWSTAMILWSPFFLPGQNLMLEGPLLCFSIWGLEFVCRSWETGQTRWAWIAGILAALAVMTKYTGGLALPLIVIGSFLAARPRSLVALIPPIVALGAYVLHNRWLYAESHLTSHGLIYHVEEWPVRILSELRTIGGLTFFAPVFAVVTWRRWRLGWLVVLATMGAAGLLAWVDIEMVARRAEREGWIPLFFQEVHYVTFVINGTLCMLLVAMLSFRRKAASGPWLIVRRFLELWILLLFVFNVTSVPFQAVRHLLLLLVPLTWLGSWWIGEVPYSKRVRQAMLLLNGCLGFGIAAADYELAGVYREIAQTNVRQLVASGRNVWFTGNWGFVYYASQERAWPLVDQPERFGIPPLQGGDVVINPRIITFVPFPPGDFPPLQAIDHLQPPASNIFRTIAPCVNYYSVHTHLLPWLLFIQRPAADEPDAFFELAPVDDVLLFQLPTPPAQRKPH